jgi:predicted RNA methylase
VQTSDFLMDGDYAAHLAAQGVGAGERVGHFASDWLTLPRILRRRDLDGEVFVDVGCGEGRMLLEAALRYRPTRCVGVELSSELAGVARANVNRAGRRLRCPVEVVEADATSWEIPADASVVYLFNPFRGAVFAGFLERLLASLDAAPRTIRLVYCLPREHEQMVASGRARVVRLGRSLRGRGDSHLLMYEVT